jgi:hypothetical protein
MVLYAIPPVVCITGQAYDYQGFLVFPVLPIESADAKRRCASAVADSHFKVLLVELADRVAVDEQRRCKLAFQGYPERIKKRCHFLL